MFLPHWSAFLEYNYMDFGTTSGTAVINAVAFPIDLKRNAQEVLVGANWRFF
jgi:opacity protein-like surface antigen